MPSAGAAPCGRPDPEADPPSAQALRATLALDEKSSRTILAFKREKDHEAISLVFTVSGCELPAELADPRLLLLTRPGSEDLGDDVVAVKSAEADGSEYVLKVDVDASRFEPGSYDGLIAVRAPYLAPNRTPISVSRSEDRWWLPLLLGAVAGLGGMLWFLGLRRARSVQLKITKPMVYWVVAACMAAGTFSVFVSYWDQQVWSLDENLIGALTAGFTGATTGAMAGLLGIVLTQPSPPGPAPPPAVP